VSPAIPTGVFSERLYQSIELMSVTSVELAVDLSRQLNLVDNSTAGDQPRTLCVLSFQPRFRFALRWMLERLVERLRAGTQQRRKSCYHLRDTCGPDLKALRAIGLSMILPTRDPGFVRSRPQPICRRLLLDGKMVITICSGHRSTAVAELFSQRQFDLRGEHWVGAVLAVDHVSTHRTLRILELVPAPVAPAKFAAVTC